MQVEVGQARLKATDRPPRTAVKSISLPRWTAVTVALDLACGLASVGVAAWLRFGATLSYHPGYVAIAVAAPAFWVAVLTTQGAYDSRYISVGAEPFRRVVNSGLILLATAAIASFIFHANLSREFVAVIVAVITPATAIVRYAQRQHLHRLISRGTTIHRVLVAGTPREVGSVVKHMQRAPLAGFKVVTICLLEPDRRRKPRPDSIPTLEGTADALPDMVLQSGADTLAIAGSSAMAPGDLRKLSWRLEGAAVRLIVAPSVTDVAGPRIIVRPVDGLPLLHIDEPDFHGPRWIVKDLLDWTLGMVIVVLFSPLMAAIALAIHFDDGGPIFFRQRRVGRNGEEFKIWKFRTMTPDAEHRLDDLHASNEHDGLLFKMRNDPRVTRVGRFLRRHSLDEMPQVINVVRGEMSLVGPRPPLPREVARYGDDVRRRLLVKPGMTGLWQINGRSDLPWEEAVRLDLHYVENWSVELDLMVLWKTLWVVVHGRGGY